MKVLIIQNKNFLNSGGGTEKILAFLANGFYNFGYQVEIATNENIEGKPVFYIHPDIKINNIYSSDIQQKELLFFENYKGKNPLKWVIQKLKRKVAKIYNKVIFLSMGGIEKHYQFNLKQKSEAWFRFISQQQPDVIITMSIGTLLEVTFENDIKVPIINSTNGRPDYDYSDLLWYRNPIDCKHLIRAYEKLIAIQILFTDYQNYLPDTFKGIIKTIPNPVPQFDEQSIVNHNIEKKRYRIINIASLVLDCKQQDKLIHIFSQISEKYENWDLYFYGTGNGYDKLKNQIELLNLENRVFLAGFTNNPLEELKNADIFMFPSKYEGFPLSLTEAMSVGLPSVGFSTCSGVNQLIEHRVSGYLAADDKEMKLYLEELMLNKDLRSKFGANAHLQMKQYEPSNILKQWNDLVTTTYSHHRNEC